MGKFTISVSDELERKFRIEVATRKSGKKGDLSLAMQEAMLLWINQPQT
jgi:hypothetical protein